MCTACARGPEKIINTETGSKENPTRGFMPGNLSTETRHCSMPVKTTGFPAIRGRTWSISSSTRAGAPGNQWVDLSPTVKADQ